MSPSVPIQLSLSFIVLAIGVVVAFVVGNAVASRRLHEASSVRRRLVIVTSIGASLWLALTAALAGSGVLERFDARPPPLLLMMATMLATALSIGLSRAGARLAHGLPMAALVGAQAFRLPLELAMHETARLGIMPERMTFTGRNFDIATGVLAIPLALLLARGYRVRALVVGWNALGAALLVNVVANAMLATPMIHAFGTGPTNVSSFIAHFPFVWLPTVLVAAAIVGHIVIFRKLLLESRKPLAVANPRSP